MHRLVRLTLLAVLSVLLAACGGGGGEKETQAPATTATTAATTAGGAGAEGLVLETPDPMEDIDRLVWALDYEPTSLDWVYAYNYAENTVLSNLCENLLRLTPDFRLEPGLAESYENPSPTTWVYRIREGVTFQDGSPLTADDVVFSLKRQLDPEVGSYWAGWLANVESVEKTGPMEVTVTLGKPDVIFNQMMATPAGGVAKKAYVEAKGAKYGTPDGGVVCTGPFALKEWRKGESLTLVRYDGYWDSPRRARAAEVEMPFITDESTMVSSLVGGQVDGTFEVPPAAIEQLQQTDAGALYFGPSMQSYDVIVSNVKGALGDARVRLALMLALDREGIVQTAVAGRAQILRAPVGPGSWGYARETFQTAWDELPGAERNVDEAKRIIAEAGVPSETITLATLAEDEELSIISNALQDAARQLGIDLQIKTLPVGKYAPLFFDAKAREGIDMFLTGWYTDVPEPLNMYATIFTSNGASNYSGYSNAEYDRLIEEAQQTDDPERRAELIVQAQRIVVEEAPWIPLYSPNVRVFLSKRITGVPTSFVYLYYPWLAEIGAAG